MKKNILDYFPFPEARAGQSQVIPLIEKAFEDDYKFVILESPVGSGKSAMAMTLAERYLESHLLTPRKNLQDQYMHDFNHLDVALMKGRSSYPCTYKDDMGYSKAVNKIRKGEILHVPLGTKNTANGPCKSSPLVYNRCTKEGVIPCPYTVATEYAQCKKHVVHNLHSFIFQANFAEKFHKKPLLVVDEAHDIESIVRGLSTIEMNLPLSFMTHKDTKRVGDYIHSQPGRAREIIDIQCYIEWLTFYEQTILGYWGTDELKDIFLNKMSKLNWYKNKEVYFTIQEYADPDLGIWKATLTPHDISNRPSDLMFEFGEKVLLMSGTIYDKNYFCKQLGINPADAYFIKVGSTFPVKNRPIYCKPEYLVDTSHANWYDNLPELGEKINKVLEVFKDKKGLIHVPSYKAIDEVMGAVDSDRLVTHDKWDFHQKLQEFYDSKDNKVFVSPICQQGVDFKDDRASFQIVTRVPYLNAGDSFVREKMKREYVWYNYQSLVIFGQMVGRVNRSESDFGVTVLMDSRFPSYIRKNMRLLPKWLTEAIIWK